MADSGGSNGSRVRLWKVELQKLAEELGFPIQVCHLPPATSKLASIALVTHSIQTPSSAAGFPLGFVAYAQKLLGFQSSRHHSIKTPRQLGVLL